MGQILPHANKVGSLGKENATSKVLSVKLSTFFIRVVSPTGSLVERSETTEGITQMTYFGATKKATVISRRFFRLYFVRVAFSVCIFGRNGLEFIMPELGSADPKLLYFATRMITK